MLTLLLHPLDSPNNEIWAGLTSPDLVSCNKRFECEGKVSWEDGTQFDSSNSHLIADASSDSSIRLVRAL